MINAYRLRELIYAKYGEAKFAIGCEIVARYINFQSSESWTMERVVEMCNMEDPDETLSIHDAEKLKELFGLKTADDLFTPALIKQ